MRESSEKRYREIRSNVWAEVMVEYTEPPGRARIHVTTAGAFIEGFPPLDPKITPSYWEDGTFHFLLICIPEDVFHLHGYKKLMRLGFRRIPRDTTLDTWYVRPIPIGELL